MNQHPDTVEAWLEGVTYQDGSPADGRAIAEAMELSF